MSSLLFKGEAQSFSDVHAVLRQIGNIVECSDFFNEDKHGVIHTELAFRYRSLLRLLLDDQSSHVDIANTIFNNSLHHDERRYATMRRRLAALSDAILSNLINPHCVYGIEGEYLLSIDERAFAEVSCLLAAIERLNGIHQVNHPATFTNFKYEVCFGFDDRALYLDNNGMYKIQLNRNKQALKKGLFILKEDSIIYEPLEENTIMINTEFYKEKPNFGAF